MGKNQLSTARRRWLASFTIAGVLLLLCTLLYALGFFEALELRSCCVRMRLRRERAIHPAIALVGISEKDIQWSEEPLPWPRTYYAIMIQTLFHHGAKAVALDFLFEDPRPADPQGDAYLKQVIQAFPNAITGFFFDLSRQPSDGGLDTPSLASNLAIRKATRDDRFLIEGEAPRWPMPGLRRVGQAGTINAPLERDGTLLRLPMVMQYQDYLFPSLCLATACRYYGVRLQDVQVDPGDAVVLKTPAGEAVRIPIDKRGRMIINFKADQETLSERQISFMRILQAEDELQSGKKPDLDLESFQGKAVCVAALLTTAKDLCVTPLGQTYGVSAHVNALSTILSGDYIDRPGGGIVFAILVVLSLLLALAGGQQSLRRGAVLAVSTFLGYLALAWIFFAHASVLLDVVAPSANMILPYVGIVTYRYFAEEREKARIRGIFARYLSTDMVQEIIQTPQELMLEGEVKPLTVLLSDIRDFTTITEELGARETVNMLNEYFEPMVRIIHKHGGAVNQFVGDEILATWGAPRERPDDPLNAVKAALEMREALAELMASREAEGLQTFAIGIGLNTGETKVGNIGTEEHMDYAVIGDTVNYAARLESMTKQHRGPDCPTPILISQSTYEVVQDAVDATPIGEIPVKGKKQVSMIYKLNGLKAKGEDGG